MYFAMKKQDNERQVQTPARVTLVAEVEVRTEWQAG